MPELPEVEVIRRGLEPLLLERKITGVRCSGKKMRWEVPEKELRSELIGYRIKDLRRRARYLIIDCAPGPLLIIHLGMTGKLRVSKAGNQTGQHDHVIWTLDDATELIFNDVRRFGFVLLVSPDDADRDDRALFGDIGPEPLTGELTAEYLSQRAAGRSKPVKNFIMDNSVVAGIGNIYANESLFEAGIRPTRPAGRISRKRWSRLVEQLRQVLERAIDCGGSTISDFLGAGGEQGYFQINFKVYGRAGQPCSHCETPIRHCKIGGRATFYCPSCQR